MLSLMYFWGVMTVHGVNSLARDNTCALFTTIALYVWPSLLPMDMSWGVFQTGLFRFAPLYHVLDNMSRSANNDLFFNVFRQNITTSTGVISFFCIEGKLAVSVCVTVRITVCRYSCTACPQGMTESSMVASCFPTRGTIRMCG